MSGPVFELLAVSARARRGRVLTAHGTVNTPCFMPVGTAGTVKAMLPDSVAATGAEIVLGNTYHLMRDRARNACRFGGASFHELARPHPDRFRWVQVMSSAISGSCERASSSITSQRLGTAHTERSIEISVCWMRHHHASTVRLSSLDVAGPCA
jgi:hypothetical protein